MNGIITYSPKVFIPLTSLCRDRCGYCTFAKSPHRVESPYLSIESILDVARAGAAGASHGQGISDSQFRKVVEPLGRTLVERTTLYASVDSYAAILVV